MMNIMAETRSIITQKLDVFTVTPFLCLTVNVYSQYSSDNTTGSISLIILYVSTHS